MQVFTYRKLLSDIRAKNYTYDNFTKIYKFTKGLSDVFKRELKAMGIHEELIDTYAMFKKMFEEVYTIPEIGNTMEVTYVDRFSGKQMSSVEIEYKDYEMNKYATYALQFWNGERESAPVVKEESRKCTFCKFFGNECKVWWNQAKL